MNRLDSRRRAQVVSALVEGASVRATCRMVDVDKGTVLKLLVDLGAACAEYQDRVLRDLPCKRIQCDEAWAFVYAKQKNVPAEKQGVFGYGDVWTWMAMDADTKLIPSWLVGKRDAGCAHALIQDLASRLASRIQLTTDGFRVYVNAVEDAFGSEIDYAMLVKVYGADPAADQTRYSPAKCIGTMPGSHRSSILPHRDTYAPDNRLSRGQEIEVHVDEKDAVDVVLRAGEMSLHHVNIIHGSNPNPSDGSRIGFAPRFTTPKTRQIDGPPPTAVLARGRDDHGHFELLPGPPTLGFDEAVAAQQAGAERFLAEIRKTRGHYAG